jgi:hypothetical protein
MDGRKNNGGHSTKGFAGRPSKADEIKIIEQMDAIAVPEEAWKALWNRCKDGDIQAIKTWLNYRFGMPKQTVDVTTQGEKVTPPIEWIKSK